MSVLWRFGSALTVAFATALGSVGSRAVVGAAVPPSPAAGIGSPVLALTLGAGLGEPLSRSAAFAARGQAMLVVGGVLGATGVPGTGAELVDTADGASRAAGGLAVPVAEAAAAVLDGDDLLIGGIGAQPGSCLGTVEQVRLSSGKQGAVTASAYGSLPAPRAGAGAAVVGGRLLVAGGYGPGAGLSGPELTSVLSSRDGRRFSTAATLAAAVRYPAVVAYQQSLWVIGGEAVQSGVPEPVADVQELRPGADVASVVAHLPEAVAAPSAWTEGGSLYVAGGDSVLGFAGLGRVTNGSIWVLDPHKLVFDLVGQLSVPVSHAPVVVAGTSAYLAGGEYHGSAVKSVQLLEHANARHG